MNLLELAKRDWAAITSDTTNGFGLQLTFTAPDNSTATVGGLKAKHHMAFDTIGQPINSKTGHISVSEKLLTDAGYTTRNDKGEVDLKGHKVTCKDSTGQNKTYTIRQWFPDETLGVILLQLGDLKTGS